MSWLSSSVTTLRTWCGNSKLGMSVQCHGDVAKLILCFASVCNVVAMSRHYSCVLPLCVMLW